MSMLDEWLEAKEAADAAKAVIKRELELRKKVLAELFDPAKEGTQKLELPDGRKLKAVVKYNRVLDKSAVLPIIPKLREMGVDPDGVIDWSPKLRLRQFRQLPNEVRELFNGALEVKPATPSLEVEDA